MSVFEIADSFDSDNRLRINLNAPLPLGYHHAIRRALELRQDNLSYPMIAIVMRQYHGVHRSESWWRRQLRSHGAEARPHGLMWHGTQRVAA